ncbi:alanine dehydrogenase [Gilvimarinus sp. DA14]|uniref:alanine dehydrogenase n=1 Tax=Gilvimarinus sp. DA14 TaxID=2956798 RepID=UPI0020B8276F|nr:alanine dehydrogenase [Gilvimarinus sp. DA14]UTF60826.1 alanine dehydrogenase [Gilvimarinus sp. DA14]
MRIGVPLEIKSEEYRVALTPAAAAELIAAGHSIFVQASAGEASGFSDAEYAELGAQVVSEAGEVFTAAELIVKVKEPQAHECRLLKPSHKLFTFLHLAASPDLARRLCDIGVTAIGYETVADEAGHLPLLTPMSEIAGRLAAQAGAHYLEKPQGGRGILLGQVGGVPAAQVTVIGGGIVGTQAARVALGLGARVSVLDTSLARLRQLDELFAGRVSLEYAAPARVAELAAQSDMCIGAVLLPGDRAPQLLSRKQVARMRPGSVLVDVAIDQGGCFATSQPTTHTRPVYEVDGVLHYCVANIPSAVARTSTIALCHATLPLVKILAQTGLSHPQLRAGINIEQGRIVHPVVARAVTQAWKSTAPSED